MQSALSVFFPKTGSF